MLGPYFYLCKLTKCNNVKCTQQTRVTCKTKTVNQVGDCFTSFGDSSRDYGGGCRRDDEFQKEKRQLSFLHVRRGPVGPANECVTVAVGKSKTEDPIGNASNNCQRNAGGKALLDYTKLPRSFNYYRRNSPIFLYSALALQCIWGLVNQRLNSNK